jgi:ribosome-binding protein aMBF1 (putative translation factor)
MNEKLKRWIEAGGPVKPKKDNYEKWRDITINNYAAILRAVRSIKGMSQQELANKSNLHVNYISGLERGKRNPSLICMLEIAKALDIPLTTFVENLQEISLQECPKK